MSGNWRTDGSDWWQNPWVILAALVGGGIALSLICWVAGVGLEKIGPALGAGVGIAGSILSGGLAGGMVASWVVPTAAVGLAVLGISAGLFGTHRVVERATENPYLWLSPVFALVAGIIAAVGQEIIESAILRVVFAGFVVISLEAGSIIIKKGLGLTAQLAAWILLIIPLLVIAAISVSEFAETISTKGFLEALLQISPITWISIVMLLILIVGLAAFSYASRD